MGGNIRVYRNGIKTTAQTINLRQIGRTVFTLAIKDVLYDIADNLDCFTTENIESGEIFNGSSQYVFSPEYSDNEIEEVKPTIGDVDVMIDSLYRDELIKYFSGLSGNTSFSGLSGNDFKGFVYNKNIDQIHSVFRIKGYNCQIDFEFTKFIDNRPSEFARFSHSSSFLDAQYGIKAVFHKFLIGAVTYSTAQNILISDYNGNLINDNKIPKFAVFSVVNGFKIKYKPLYDKTRKQFVTRNGMQVFVKNTDKYSTNVKHFYKYLFNVNNLNDYEKFWTFIGVCELIKMNFTRDKILDIHNKFAEMLLGHVVSKDPNEDYNLKYNAYKVFIDILGFEDFFNFFMT